ncbi:thioredoxin [Candidatus Dojkabacteria bacterium]|nr:thioredoxin [Candidatus Dojkabacteria bacterium]
MANIEVTDSTFKKEVLESDKVTVVDFWAEWCMPCKMLGPIIDELSDELGDKVKVCKVNVDTNREVSTKYNIMSIPAVFIFKDGEAVDQLVGLRAKEDYLTALEKYLK